MRHLVNASAPSYRWRVLTVTSIGALVSIVCGGDRSYEEQPDTAAERNDRHSAVAA
jgi:hypothetical protein